MARYVRQYGISVILTEAPRAEREALSAEAVPYVGSSIEFLVGRGTIEVNWQVSPVLVSALPGVVICTATTRRPSSSSCQELKDLANGLRGVLHTRHRKVVLDLVAVTSAISRLDDVSLSRQIIHDAICAPLGDPELKGHVLQSDLGIVRDAQKGSAVIGKEVPTAHGGNLAANSRNQLREIHFRCNLRSRPLDVRQR